MLEGKVGFAIKLVVDQSERIDCDCTDPIYFTDTSLAVHT